MEKQQTFEEFLKNLKTEFSIVYIDKVPAKISDYVTYNDILVVADENLNLELAVLGDSVGSNGEGHYCKIINSKNN